MKDATRSLRKHSEGGTSFETATLIGLIADEWQLNYTQWTMRLEFAVSLDWWTGVLAYITVLEAPPQSPKHSPAPPAQIVLPPIKKIASTNR